MQRLLQRLADLAQFGELSLGSKVFVSVDNGTTWIKRDEPPFVIQEIHFDDAKTGHAVRSRIGTFVNILELRTYDAAKGTWKKLFDAPEGCVRILHDAARSPRFCVTNGNSILVNTGETWAAEFSLQ